MQPRSSVVDAEISFQILRLGSILEGCDRVDLGNFLEFSKIFLAVIF